MSVPVDQLPCRVLLVEDDPDHQPLLALILRKAGAEVAIADNGQAAIQMACAARDVGSPFDLIVMDVLMPVLDGLSTTRWLREAGFKTPIIALSARAVSTNRDKCLAAGCNDFVAKPTTRIGLIQVLADHLKRSLAVANATNV